MVKLSEAAIMLGVDIKTLHARMREAGIEAQQSQEDKRSKEISDVDFLVLQKKLGGGKTRKTEEIAPQKPKLPPIIDHSQELQKSSQEIPVSPAIPRNTEKQPLLSGGHMVARALLASDANIYTRVQLLEELLDWQDQQIRKLIRHVKVIEEVLRSQAHYDLELSDPELQAVKAINEETDRWAAGLDKKEGKANE